MGRRLLLPALLLAALATGCLYFTDLTGLAGGSAPTSPDGSTDALTDADGANPPDAGGVSPCTGSAAGHFFCADFDDGPLGMGWDRTDIDPITSLALDDVAVSKPFSMRAKQPRRPTTKNVITRQAKNLGTTWKKTVFNGDVLMQPPAWLPGDSNVGLVVIYYQSATLNSGTVLFINEANATGTVEHQPNGPSRYLDGPPLPYGRWVHVIVEFDPSSGLAYSFDGVRNERKFAAVSAGSGPTFALEVGAIGYNVPVPAFDIRWDNITIDLF